MLKNNFIDTIIQKDIKSGKYSNIITRFPPEPNGYLHLGHIKSIELNFSLAKKYSGVCNLRFDDTNPSSAFKDFYDNIQKQLSWLNFDTNERIFYASDYFPQFYTHANELILKGLAYVCFLNPKECQENRGTLTTHGINSPYRNTSIEDNLILFEKMKDGAFEEGQCTLRAKINMCSGNMNLRDPIIYRIKNNIAHPRTGYTWCIYPSYDYAHTISDVIERISHSLCTLEFQDHKPLYNWFLEALEFAHKPTQIEFARLQVKNCITSKRKIKDMIEANIVSTWDDPRLATIEGLKNRGYTASSLVKFCSNLGVSKQDSIIEKALLEQTLRLELDHKAERRFVVKSPIKLIIKEDITQILQIDNHPKDTTMGSRSVSISSNIFIEKDDFAAVILPGQKKLTINGYVRLLGLPGLIYCYAYKGGEILCKFIAPIDAIGLKPQGTLHWVDASNFYEFKMNIYEPELKTYLCLGEASLKDLEVEARVQCYRSGYIYKYNTNLFNFIIPLKSNV